MGVKEFNVYDVNPFLDSSLEVIGSSSRRRYKVSSQSSESAVLEAFDPKSGEVLGRTQFVRNVIVDEGRFVKLYLDNYSDSFFNLSSQGLRVFGYVLTKLVPDKDIFIFDKDECLRYTGYRSERSVFMGLDNLLKNGIIARTIKEYRYFINPLIVFNGNRITYAKNNKLKR